MKLFYTAAEAANVLEMDRCTFTKWYKQVAGEQSRVNKRLFVTSHQIEQIRELRKIKRERVFPPTKRARINIKKVSI